MQNQSCSKSPSGIQGPGGYGGGRLYLGDALLPWPLEGPEGEGSCMREPTGRWVLSEVFLPARVLPMGAHDGSMSRNVLVLSLSS